MLTNLLFAQDLDVGNHLRRLADKSSSADLANLILGLKTDGIWLKIDVLCVVGPNVIDSYLNLRGPAIAPDSSEFSGAIPFTADESFQLVSYASSGQTNTITLNYAETDGPNLAQYDAHMMLYAYDKPTGSDDEIFYNRITSTRSIITNKGTSNQWHAALQNIGPNVSTTAAGTVIGSRTAIDAQETRVNDTAATNVTSFTASLLSLDFKIGGATSGTDKATFKVSAWGTGSGLTSAEMGLYEDRIRTYAQARGFDVY